MGLKIVVDTSRFTSVKSLVATFGDARIMKAARRGLMEHVRLQERQAVRLVAAQTKVPEGRVGAISSVQNLAGGMSGAVRFEDSAIPLGEQTFRSWSRSASGASAGDWKTKTYPHSFTIARFGGAIYVRTTKSRFPIQRLWGPVLPNELRRPDQPALPAAQRFADQDLERRVLRHIAGVI